MHRLTVMPCHATVMPCYVGVSVYTVYLSIDRPMHWSVSFVLQSLTGMIISLLMFTSNVLLDYTHFFCVGD